MRIEKTENDYGSWKTGPDDAGVAPKWRIVRCKKIFDPKNDKLKLVYLENSADVNPQRQNQRYYSGDTVPPNVLLGGAENKKKRQDLGWWDKGRDMEAHPQGSHKLDPHEDATTKWYNGPEEAGVCEGFALVLSKVEQDDHGKPLCWIKSWAGICVKMYSRSRHVPEGVLLRGRVNMEKRRALGWIDYIPAPTPPPSESVLGKHPRDSDEESVAQELEAARQKIRLMESLAATQNVQEWVANLQKPQKEPICPICDQSGKLGVLTHKDSPVSCGHCICGECADRVLNPEVFDNPLDADAPPVCLDRVCPFCRARVDQFNPIHLTFGV